MRVPAFCAPPKCIGLRCAIEGEHEKPTWRNHRCRFFEGLPHVARVVQDAPAIDDIEAAVLRWVEIKDADLLGLPMHGGLVLCEQRSRRGDAIRVNIRCQDTAHTEPCGGECMEA